jgi:phosphatidylserine/phosphatidylglycerophosphate/cardiolipin synthase-like enzyme
VRIISLVIACLCLAPSAWAQDQIYFPAVDDVRARLVQHIEAETSRIDMSVSLLTDRAVSTALVNRFKAGVPVRLMGDRYSIFDFEDPARRTEFYWLASQGVPIRLRANPRSFPEIVQWKATIFAGQNIVSFGSANYTPLELVRQASGAYADATVMFTSDLALVNAFKSQFDRMWHDTDREVDSIFGPPPYLRDWDDACAVEPACADYRAQFPNPVPMIVDTRRLEPDAPTPADLLWGQGRAFNDRLVSEIERENSFIDVVVYRLTVDSITDALLARHAAGVPVRVIVEPDEYRNTRFLEFWLTAPNLDRLHRAGIPIKQRAHAGLTHMKMLVTSRTATNASSNFSSAWQRDHNYFVSASAKPAIYSAMRARFNAMWNDAAAFVSFTPLRPDTPALQEPANNAVNVSPSVTLLWRRTPFATAYDVYLGTSASTMTRVATVGARLIDDPPPTYFFSPLNLQPRTTYFWRIVGKTNALLEQPSATRTFTTGDAPPLTASPRLIEVGARAASGVITVTASAGTAWTATSSENFVLLSPASGSGTRSITYSIAYNASAAERTATISIGGVLIAVLQAPDAIPGVPGNLTAAVTRPDVLLTWTPPTTGGEALRYQIDIANNPAFANARFITTDVGGPPRLRLTNQTPGQYYARVTAVNAVGVGTPTPTIDYFMPAPPPAGGGGGGGTGGGGGGGAEAPAPTAPTVSPFAPQGVNVQVIGRRVTLTWRAPLQGAPTSYVVEAGLAPRRTDYVLPTPARSLVVDNVPIGVYYVRIRSISPGGPNDASLEMPIGVGVPVPGPAPAAPGNLSASVSGSNVTLRWAPSAPADAMPTHYVLEAGMAPGASNAAVMPVGPQTTLSVGAVPSGRYYVRVRSANGTSLSAPSNEIVVTVR